MTKYLSRIARFSGVFSFLLLAASPAAAVQFAGLWRAGFDANYVNYGLDVPTLTSLVNQRFTNNLRVAQNLRVIDVETYVDGGTRYWAGLWRSGTDSSAFASNLTDGGFDVVNQIHHLNGRELIDVESYPDSFGVRHWAGIWRANVT